MEKPQISIKKGFTIIEVVLFIAISGLLFIVIYSSINGTIARSQFNEASRDLQAKLQLHFNEVLNGISDGAIDDCLVGPSSISFQTATNTVSGDNEDCLALGKLITVNTNSLDIELLAGKRLGATELSQDSMSLVQDSFPTVYKTNSNATRVPKTIDYRWNATVNTGDVTITGNDGSTSFQGSPEAFAFIRNPRSGDVLTIAYINPTVIDHRTTAPINDYSQTYVVYDANISICLSKDGNHAIIGAGSEINSNEITLTKVEACP